METEDSIQRTSPWAEDFSAPPPPYQILLHINPRNTTHTHIHTVSPTFTCHHVWGIRIGLPCGISILDHGQCLIDLLLQVTDTEYNINILYLQKQLC